MSVVCNTVLMHSIHERKRGDPPTYFVQDQIELYFQTGTRADDRDSRRGLVSVDDPSLPRGWYGGTKMLELEVLVGAFNYLSVSEFVDHLSQIKWEQPEAVVLVLQDQHWEAPRVYRFRSGKLEKT